MERIPAPEPGIYPDIPEEEYRAWSDAYNWSALKRCSISMEQFHWDWHNPDEKDTKPRFEGRVLHEFFRDPKCAKYVCTPEAYPVLEKCDGAKVSVRVDSDDGRGFVVGRGLGKARKTWDVQILGGPDEYTLTGSIPDGLVEIKMQAWGPGTSKFCAAWKQEQESHGRIVTTMDVLERCRGMAYRLRNVPDILEFLDGAQHEVSIVWIDPQTQLKCKSRLDVLKGAGIADLKSSARSVDNDTFAWEVKRWEYAGQGGMYLDGLKQAMKALGKGFDGAPWFEFWAVQNFPPYTPHPWCLVDDPSEQPISFQWLQYGRQVWHSYLQQVAHCLKTGEWPGHHHEGQPFPSREELFVPSNMTLLPKDTLL
ncbi:MAG TPA: PD-(D/E)XK nuclease-like domain-containing protein [Phycisphaerae bacterium]|nr:PD-(D/E)XK nuclease-like domain-containing protein [Phycisphaerae bacterium]